MSPYLSRIEGSPPKRNAAGSIPVGDATNSAESLDFTGLSAFFLFRNFYFCFVDRDFGSSNNGHIIRESDIAKAYIFNHFNNSTFYRTVTK